MRAISQDAEERFPTKEESDIKGISLQGRTRETALIGLDAEPLCGLGKRIEAAVAPSRGITLGYVNRCVSHLPDTRQLKRGGYEVDSFLFSNWSGPWLPGLEDVVVDGVTQLQA